MQLGICFLVADCINKEHYTATSITFRFSLCIIIVNHFYCPNNALNYTKLRG